MKMKRKLIWLTVLVSVIALILTFALNGKASIIYDGSLDETNRMILTYLDLDESNFTNKHNEVVSSTNSPLFGLTETVYHVSIHKHLAFRKTSILLKHEYNIGASGSESIYFNIVPTDDNHTQMTIDYNDSWVGIWPPFVWWNPGVIMEHRIKSSLNSFIKWQSEGRQSRTIPH